MPELEQKVQEALNRAKAAMAAYSGPDDSPPARICRGLAEAVQGVSCQVSRMETAFEAGVVRVEGMIKAIETRPQHQLRQSFRLLEPEYRKKWTWMRWSCLIAAWSVSISATGLLVGKIEHDLGAAESLHWSAWCAAPDNQVVSKGGKVCQVPMQ